MQIRDLPVCHAAIVIREKQVVQYANIQWRFRLGICRGFVAGGWKNESVSEFARIILRQLSRNLTNVSA